MEQTCVARTGPLIYETHRLNSARVLQHLNPFGAQRRIRLDLRRPVRRVRCGDLFLLVVRSGELDGDDEVDRRLSFQLFTAMLGELGTEVRLRQKLKTHISALIESSDIPHGTADSGRKFTTWNQTKIDRTDRSRTSVELLPECHSWSTPSGTTRFPSISSWNRSHSGTGST